MISTKSLNKLGLLGCLYVSQFLPTAFLYQALPVFMRQQGVSLKTISFLSLLILPSALNFLWSPLIDRYSFTTLGHYRFWIICLQVLIACTTVIGGLLNIEHNVTALLICLFVMCFLCACQNIATDALALGLLEVRERSLGNGVQMGGNYLGAVIGGGWMLSLLNYWGWMATMLTLAFLVVVALFPILRYEEPNRNNQQVSQTKLDSQRSTPALMNLVKFFRRQGMWRWLLVLLLYMKGSIMASTMYRLLLVDIGLSLSEIGLLLGVVSYTVGIFGAIAAGFLINPLGRKRSLILFGLFQAVAMMTYLLPASGVTSLPILYLVAIVVQFSVSLTSTAVFTIVMDKSELETAGTDQTIQSSILSFSGISAAAISGVIAESFGYQGVFVLGVVITLLSVVITARVFDETRSTQDSPLISG
ncbi:arabinose efflux permease family protein [Cylindrospermum stagnale PCC 7417]|uniref:Arabinose efflux permease family protein n=1 Tax=Cylindrospermum stagnale PCC 7417 TaxID=56107 RepID=K9X0F7_9NOST|nr:MFS transporter [Cylindrospermum stagnale]AFZ26075.1 arabinose efflux permease family protein [Cylindrospermum stagnale PCC 7417]